MPKRDPILPEMYYFSVHNAVRKIEKVEGKGARCYYREYWKGDTEARTGVCSEKRMRHWGKRCDAAKAHELVPNIDQQDAATNARLQHSRQQDGITLIHFLPDHLIIAEMERRGFIVTKNEVATN